MFRILIDARWIRTGKRGIGNFTDALIDNLSFIKNENTEITIAVPRNTAKVLQDRFKDSFRYLLLPSIPDPFLDIFYFSFIQFIYNFNVVHFTGNSGLILFKRRGKVVLTLHDVSFMKHKSIMPWPQRFKQKIGRIYRRYLVPIYVKNANKIVTVSKFASTDIMSEFSFINDIEYLYHGINIIPLNNVASFIDLNKLIKNSYLVIAGNDPQKNLVSVILVFSLLYDNHGNSAPSVSIIGLNLNDFKKYNKRLNITPNIQFIGYLEQSQVQYAIQLCKCVIIPSYYESFGLPLIEALCRGKYVICSNRGALPEIGLDAPIYFNPNDKKSLFDAVNYFESSDFRSQPLNIWLKNSSFRFSWKKTSSRYFQIYHEL